MNKMFLFVNDGLRTIENGYDNNDKQLSYKFIASEENGLFSVYIQISCMENIK